MHRAARLTRGAAAGAVLVVAVCAIFLRCRAESRDTPAEVGARSEAEQPASLCDHPFVPLEPGTRWRYGARSEIDDTRATVTGEVLPAGRVRWRAEPAGGRGRPTEWTVRARCTDEGAEEPWFGLLDGMLGAWSTMGSGDGGTDVTAPRWLVPRALSAGATFGGETRLERRVEGQTVALVISRRYRVEARERVELPDGREATAWRASFTERQRVQDREGEWTGAMWLVEDMGLLRMEASPGGQLVRWDLLEHRQR